MKPRDEAEFFAALPTKRIAAGVLFTDPDSRVLLVQPSYKSTWDIPGGVVEEGESPRAAARRQVGQELSIDVQIGSLLVLDWVSPAPPRTDGLMLIYDGGPLDEYEARSIRLAAGELNAYGFVDMESAVGLVSERLERRIKAALRARQVGRAIELEDGRPQIAREMSLET